MKKLLRRVLFNEKAEFQRLCQRNGLQLDYSLNQAGLSVLSAIFRDREYADYFPFQEDATVVDVGAHFGYFTLFARQNIGAGGRVFSLEPSEHNFRILQENLRANGGEPTTTNHLALAGQSGTLQLFTGRAENNSILEDYSLLEGEAKSQSVHALTLEDFIRARQLEHIDFLKLDCEGAEYDILQAASDETLRRVTTISMEFHDLKQPGRSSWELVERLRQAGFTIVKYRHEASNRNLNYGKLIASRRLS